MWLWWSKCAFLSVAQIPWASCYFQSRDSLGSIVCPPCFLQVICHLFLGSVSFPCIVLTVIRERARRSPFGHACIINLPGPFRGESAVQKVSPCFCLSARLTVSETLHILSERVSSHYRFKENLKCVKMQLMQRCMGV